MPPATAIYNLLIGQDCLAQITPVNISLLFVGQVFLKHLEKDKLFPAVIFRPAGSQLPIPIVTESHPLELGSHVVDVIICPFCRMGLILYCRVLGRHAKGIPPHGMQHVETPHLFVSRDNISDSIISDVTHVYLA